MEKTWSLVPEIYIIKSRVSGDTGEPNHKSLFTVLFEMKILLNFTRKKYKDGVYLLFSELTGSKEKD